MIIKYGTNFLNTEDMMDVLDIVRITQDDDIWNEILDRFYRVDDEIVESTIKDHERLTPSEVYTEVYSLERAFFILWFDTHFAKYKKGGNIQIDIPDGNVKL